MYIERRIRQRKGSANLARVRLHTLAMAHEVQAYALRAESEWEYALRDKIALEVEAVAAPYMKQPYPNVEQAHAYRTAIRMIRGISNANH
jgi:ABC-type tungstate transport system permease subunit